MGSGARLIGWWLVYSPSHLSVVGYLQGLMRVAVPPTNLLHPGIERSLLVRNCLGLFVGKLPFISQLVSISRGRSTIRHPWRAELQLQLCGPQLYTYYVYIVVCIYTYKPVDRL